MKTNIKFIGFTGEWCKGVNSYPLASFLDFMAWEREQTEYQLDIETNVTDELPLRRLKVIQFGNRDVQWVIQWDYLIDDAKQAIKFMLEDTTKRKYIHNAMFEYTVLRCVDIRVENVVCTMLQEKILYTGLEQIKGFFSLAGLVNRYLKIELSKEEQKSFDVDYYTDEQIEYAARDVLYLQDIDTIQQQKLTEYSLLKVAELENGAVCAFGDITYNGMLLDQKAWRENYVWANDIVNELFIKLTDYVKTNLLKQVTRLDYYNAEDTILLNWKSPKQRKLIFQQLYPGLPGVTKVIIKKYADENKVEGLWEYLEQEYEFLEDELLTNHKQFLLDNELMVAGGTLTINWGSPAQRLRLFKTILPGLESTSKDALATAHHPLVDIYKEYIKVLKLTTSFGEKFIQDNVDVDGYVRTNFNQILNTGRVSSAKPNMQQIPAYKLVGNRYRNCFIAPEDWKFVSSDFNSQELVVIATISKEKVWLDALRRGEDLHSICADLVFAEKWANAAEDGCAYVAHKQKCKCDAHGVMRTTIKTINFGLAYGASAHKIATIMQISIEEAEATVKKYFEVFPKLENKLTQLGAFGMVKGYIITPPPYHRRRWFKEGPQSKILVGEHLNGDYKFRLGVIERASKNMPIQGGSGDMTKLALVKMRNHINHNKLNAKVKLVMQVHDQIDTICHKDYAEVWQKEMTTIMEDAAKVVIPSGLLTSETNISNKWEK